MRAIQKNADRPTLAVALTAAGSMYVPEEKTECR